jgi:uncharacterized protein (TIGR03067 family)
MCPTLLLAIVLGAPALKDPPNKAADLTGEWVVEGLVYSGRPRPVGKDPQRHVFAPDGTWTVTRGERKLSGNRAYRVDATTDPPTITLKYDAAEQDGPEAFGIFQVTGNTLTLCYARPGSTRRPTAFESAPGSGINLIILKRARPKD